MIHWIQQQQWYKKRSPLLRAVFWVFLFNLLLNLIFLPTFLLFTHVSFRSIENNNVRHMLQNGRDVIQQEIDGIIITARDYASWNDTYDYIQTRDQAFIADNFDDSALNNLNINVYIILDHAGNIVHANAVNFLSDQVLPFNLNIAALLEKYPELLDQKDINGAGIQGLINIDGKIILVNARPILTSQYQGPSRGTLIFGRILDAREDLFLSRLSHFPMTTQILEAPPTSTEMQLAKYVLTGSAALPAQSSRPAQCSVCHPVSRGSLAQSSTDDVFVSPLNDEFLGGYTLLQDIQQNPIAILGIHLSREIEQLETRYAMLFVLSFMGLLTVFSFFGVKIIAKSISNEEALDREYKLLRAVIDNVPEQIYAHDIGGRYLLNNLRDAQVMGVQNPEDLLGKSDFDYYSPELAANFLELERQVILTGKPIVDAEGTMTRNDGKQHWILTTKTPMRDQDGQVTGVVGITRDITERKQRERELEVIVTMSRALRSAETSTKLLLLIYNEVIHLLHADYGTLELIDPASADAEVVYSYGFDNPLDGMRIPAEEGLNSYIRASKKPYIDNHLAENPMAFNLLVHSGCMAIAGAPMLAEGELIGFLWMGRKTSISETEVHLLAAMADIAASSIRRITLYELTRKQLDQLTSLRKIDTSINNSKDLQATLSILLDQTCTQLRADAADVLLCSQDAEILHHEYGQGFTTTLFDHPSMGIDDGPAGRAAKTKTLVQIQNLAELGPAHPLEIAAKLEGFISYIAAPLLVHGEIKGVLEVFFRKKFTPDHDWLYFLETLAGQAAIAIEQVQLFKGLQRSNTELAQAYEETIEGWVKALDLRDKETEGHSLRVARLCVELAAALGFQGEDLIHIRRGALLHDIGKVGVPDHILHKPGKLTDEEWVVMRGHPQFAKEMLSPINYLHPALSIPYCHHEKWDGTGYPCGSKAEEIPLPARIFSIIDVWDALSNDRPYRKAWSKDAVMQYIREQSGIHFDPRVVNAFLGMIANLPEV